ncbi:unnamed protein product [Gulo gulo]|uniref:Uncharacterized protein n=1 Tax=Gulo gulo TaxID=48420 RepID=A0A9X9M1K5_GULGU|nr:unnamed protein product [Gulo gulo]
MPVQEKQEPKRHNKDRTVQPGHSMMNYQPFSTTYPLNWTHEPTCSFWKKVLQSGPVGRSLRWRGPYHQKGEIQNPLGQGSVCLL